MGCKQQGQSMGLGEVAGLGAMGCARRGFPEPEPAKLYLKYRKTIFVQSVLNYLQVDDST